MGRAIDKKLTVDQFLTEDGRTFRTREVHERLQKICNALGDPTLADRVFGENHAVSIMAKERNGWKPTTASFLEDVQKTCMKHDHGGLWNSMEYNTREVVSIDMKACYPTSFQGLGKAQLWFQRFGHPKHRMMHITVNGPLPPDIGTRFAQVHEWEFSNNVHPVIPAWFGRHSKKVKKGWAPTQLLVCL